MNSDSRIPAITCMAALIVISVISGFTINGIIVSNAPLNVPFTLGTADRNVIYCNSQSLDIYIPSAAVRPLSLAVYVHGGGLTSGDKTDINPVFLNALASAGYAVASVNYPLAPQYKFPVQIDDVKCAIRYLRENAQLYGINGSKIVAFGESYGGELVSLAALTGHQSIFDVGPYTNDSSSLIAAVDMFGPANLTGWISSSDFQRIFGGNQSNLIIASPTHFVTTNSPPIMIVQGVDDVKVPESQSIWFYNELRGAGVSTELVLVQNSGHMYVQVGSQSIEPSLSQIAQDMVNFFGKYVGSGS